MFKNDELMTIENMKEYNDSNLEKLLHDILKYLRNVTKSDAGTIYLKDSNNNLRFSIFQNDTLDDNTMEYLADRVANIKLPIKKDTHTIAVESYVESKIITVDDIYMDLEFDFLSAKEFDKEFSYQTKSILTAPLLSFSSKDKIGVVQLINKKNDLKKNIPFVSEDKTFISLSSYLITLSINNTKDYINTLELANKDIESKIEKRTKSLELLHEQLVNQANKDPLTNLYNRRYFNDISENLLNISRRELSDLSILMLDIDNFKNINDSCGHEVGDEILKSLASILNKVLRDSDIPVRFGGDEFVVILPNTSIDNSIIIANKLINEVRNTVINSNNRCNSNFDNAIDFTISIGSALFESDDNNIEEVLHKADKALYKSKEQGKNQVSIFEA